MLMFGILSTVAVATLCPLVVMRDASVAYIDLRTVGKIYGIAALFIAMQIGGAWLIRMYQ